MKTCCTEYLFDLSILEVFNFAICLGQFICELNNILLCQLIRIEINFDPPSSPCLKMDISHLIITCLSIYETKRILICKIILIMS